MAKTPRGHARPAYLTERRDAKGRFYDRDGCRLVMAADEQPRRGVEGDKLRRKAHEGKL